jgi:hypothetical protein
LFHCMITSLTEAIKDNNKIDNEISTIILGVKLDGSWICNLATVFARSDIRAFKL